MAKTKKGKFRGKVSKNAQRQQEQTSSFGHLQIPSGVQVFKEPTSGRMMIDIIPYEVTDPKHPDRDDDVDAAQVGDLWYRRPYKVHRNIGTDGVSLVCPTTAGKKCPICEYRALRLKEGASYKDQEMKDLKPKDRSLYAVIPIDMNKYDEEIHIWDMSDFLFQRQLNEELMEDDENDDFPDLEEGKTLKLRLSEESFGQNKYGKVTRVDFEEREEPYGEDILDEVPNLDKVIRIPNYKEVERTFYELDDEDESEPAAEEGVRDPDDDGGGEEEERPRRKKKSADSGETNRRRTRKSDDDGEEEEKASPRRRRSRSSRNKNEDEGEEDDSDDDDDRPRAGGEGYDSGWKGREGAEEEQYQCPYGYRFGVDTDVYDECDKCELWEQCVDAKEAAEET